MRTAQVERARRRYRRLAPIVDRLEPGWLGRARTSCYALDTFDAWARP